MMDVQRAAVIQIGDLLMGGTEAVRIQSMTNTPTMDTLATVEQTERLVRCGCEMVRITARNTTEAANLSNIRKELYRRGCRVPLIADIHFNPEAALTAARIVEKVRINPGNYCDRPKKGRTFSAAEYDSELERIAERLQPLITVCSEEGTAIRVGTNHGSLSQRILDRYGNTAEGMVESAMEFVRIIHGMGFRKLVLSMKSSDIRIMLESCRLLFARMRHEGFAYPLHLGVTEAGAGEDGIIRSACGMGPLLADGIGDTIRVSLTGDPETEIPVACKLAELFAGQRENPLDQALLNYKEYRPKESFAVKVIGPQEYPVSAEDWRVLRSNGKTLIAEAASDQPQEYPVFSGFQEYHNDSCPKSRMVFIDTRNDIQQVLENCEHLNSQVSLIVDAGAQGASAFMNKISEKKNDASLVLRLDAETRQSDDARIYLAAKSSCILEKWRMHALWFESSDPKIAYESALSILQSYGIRRSRAEFISCPSCGRTEFNISAVLDEVKQKCSHLKHLKIAVMGCIVNGPGEMSDADYGCVGMGNEEVALYRHGEIVKKHVSRDLCVEELITIIKNDGNWV
jgi:(E)-4-hydroxy-3-methylbut-2-enyl-diphosphate synthase